MDDLQSVGVGLALGLVVVSVLTLYPGEPFEYTNVCGDTSKSLTPVKTVTPSVNPPQPNNTSTEERQQQIAEIERAAQRVKIQKLQELLGLEKEKAQQLIEHAKQQAKDAVTTQGQSTPTSYSTSNKSAWLDRGFFTLMLGLLVWVLWQDYGIDVFSIAAHVFPREAEVIHQVVATPRGLLSQLLKLWE